MTEETVKTAEAAKILGVGHAQISYMVHEKKFRPVGKTKTTPGTRGAPQHLFRRSDILAYAARRSANIKARHDRMKKTPCVVCGFSIQRKDNFCRDCGEKQLKNIQP